MPSSRKTVANGVTSGKNNLNHHTLVFRGMCQRHVPLFLFIHRVPYVRPPSPLKGSVKPPSPLKGSVKSPSPLKGSVGRGRS